MLEHSCRWWWGVDAVWKHEALMHSFSTQVSAVFSREVCVTSGVTHCGPALRTVSNTKPHLSALQTCSVSPDSYCWSASLRLLVHMLFCSYILHCLHIWAFRHFALWRNPDVIRFQFFSFRIFANRKPHWFCVLWNKVVCRIIQRSKTRSHCACQRVWLRFSF